MSDYADIDMEFRNYRDRIADLEARIEALEAALREIEYEDTLISYDGKDREYGSCAEMARAALDQEAGK
jgi:hypothetical protein